MTALNSQSVGGHDILGARPRNTRRVEEQVLQGGSPWLELLSERRRVKGP